MFKIMKIVFILILGIKPENYCVYCCLSEFGSESRQDREKCLHKCIEVKNNLISNFRMVMMDQPPLSFLDNLI